MVIVKTCKARRRRRRTQDIPRPNWKKLNEYLSQNPVSLNFLSNPFRSGFGFAKNIWEVFGIPKLVYLESRHLKSAAAPELNLGCAPWNIIELRMNGSEKKSEQFLFFENMTVLTGCFYRDTSTGQARRTLVAGQRPRLRASYPGVKLTLKIWQLKRKNTLIASKVT